MHRSEQAQLIPCAACGVEVSQQDRAYPFGDDELLCFACATERNGVYDEAHDRWATEPDVADLVRSTAEQR